MKKVSYYPPSLKKGDLIRIVSPAGPVESGRLNKGVEVLESFGYNVDIAPYALSKNGYTAGTTTERLFDLLSSLTDPKVSAVICSRGGYGVIRLLDHFPWKVLIGEIPKIFIGFSDISAFQIPLWERCGWISFSGPQVAALGSIVNQESTDYLQGILDGSVLNGDEIEIGLTPIRDGLLNLDCDLIPCCLSILLSLMGTPYFPDLTGKILCIEDINEPMYRIERMLWQLEASGTVNSIEGLMLGNFLNKGENQDISNIVSDIFNKHKFPIWQGLPYGHGEDCMTLPVGGKVSFTIR